MAQTVVGFFDKWEQAESAKDRLITVGFSPLEIQINAHPAASGEDADSDDGVMEGVRNFFYDLFGGEHVDAGPYSEGVRRGGAVIAVSHIDDDRVEEARNALLTAGAVDLETCIGRWREEGYTGFDPAAKPFGRAELEAARGDGDPTPVLGDRGVDLKAVRVYASAEREPERQRQYREHYEANFAGQGDYDEYHPAYLYGYSLRADPTYTDRTWELAEADARAGWEQQHGETSWDRFKAAVRRGWESIAG